MADTATQRAKELVKEYPKTANLTLARMLNEEFTNLTREQARSRIRYQRGAHGKTHRKSKRMEKTIKVERSESPPEMPKPLQEFDEWKFRQLRAKRVLVLSDVHCPYHDPEALQLAVDKGKEMGVDAVLFNGDFMDFFSISRWQKDPRNRNFKKEVELGREMLAYFREQFKGAQIWWKLGNHEERWEAFMWNKAPEICGIEEFEIESWMQTDKHNIKVIRNMEPVRINNLTVLHGHEYKFAISNPVNPARGLYLRAKVPTIMGHLHQTSEHTESNINGTICTTWSTGCLCNLRPSYSPLNKWNLGFAIVDTTGEDDFTVHNYRIWGGRIL